MSDEREMEASAGALAWSAVDAGTFRWRDRRITHRIVGRMYTLGLISGSGATTNGLFETEYGWRLIFVRWTGRRPYVLGIKRERWGHPYHRVRLGHWPTNVGLGLCGICAPWPCCGATGYDHAEGCGEDR